METLEYHRFPGTAASLFENQLPKMKQILLNRLFPQLINYHDAIIDNWKEYLSLPVLNYFSARLSPSPNFVSLLKITCGAKSSLEL